MPGYYCWELITVTMIALVIGCNKWIELLQYLPALALPHKIHQTPKRLSDIRP
jgi:hypothetical protein